MRIIHLDLKVITTDRVELRWFEENPYDYAGRWLGLAEIEPLLQQAEQGYYVSPRLREDLGLAGRRLFDWLDGDERDLTKRLVEGLGTEMVLAIATAEGLANLPWELLHDGAQFLVERQPAVVPVRWLASDGVIQLTPTSQPRNRALQLMMMATSPLEVQQALELYQQSLAVHESIGDVQGKAATLHCMAIIYAQQGQVQQALELYQQSLTLKESIGDVQGKAATLHQMAGIYAQQGQVQQALELYQQSLAVHESIGDVKGKAATLHCMAIIYAQQGQVQQALELYQQSLTLHESIGNVQGKAATLHQMAGIYAQQGQVQQALELYQQSLTVHESIRDVKGKAATLHCMAIIYAQQGQVQQALELYQQSLTVHESIGNVQGKAATLHCMAGIYAQQGQVQQALELYQQSLTATESIGDVQGKAATLHQMAMIYAQQGQVQQALELYQQSLTVHESIGNVQGKAATLNQLAAIEFERGETTTALALLRQSAQALAQAEAYFDLFTVLGNLGVADAQQPQVYLAQALWLGLRIQLPLPNLIALVKFFYNAVPQADLLKPLLATTALFFCQTQGENHPELAQLQTASLNLLAHAAGTRGATVTSTEDVNTWMAQQQLNDPEVFLPQLNQRLNDLIGNQWLFDPKRIAP